jgi:hypothetical protein
MLQENSTRWRLAQTRGDGIRWRKGYIQSSTRSKSKQKYEGAREVLCWCPRSLFVFGDTAGVRFNRMSGMWIVLIFFFLLFKCVISDTFFLYVYLLPPSVLPSLE